MKYANAVTHSTSFIHDVIFLRHACGENPRSSYGNTRMDNIWDMRQAYDTARKIMEKQNEYCEKVVADKWENLGAFPEDLQWESTVDLLRGRVKVLMKYIVNYWRLTSN